MTTFLDPGDSGAERYIARQKQEPEFRAAHAAAGRRIRQLQEGTMRATKTDRYQFMVTLETNDRRPGVQDRLQARLTREVELQFGDTGTVRPVKKKRSI